VIKELVSSFLHGYAVNNNEYTGYDQFYLRDKPTPISAYQKRCKGFGKKLSQLLAVPRDRKILDLGCGVGFLVFFLKRQGFDNVTGIDKNENLISIAKSKVNAEFIVDDGITYLEKQKTQYDIIFLWNVLEHIPKENVMKSLRVLHKSLSDDGFMVARTPNMTNIMAQGHFCDDFTHNTAFTEQSIAQVAKLAGFSNVEMLNQFKFQNFKGRIKAVINWFLHKTLLWLRGGTECRVFYRNLYVVLRK